jgi:hypothetical protein
MLYRGYSGPEKIFPKPLLCKRAKKCGCEGHDETQKPEGTYDHDGPGRFERLRRRACRGRHAALRYVAELIGYVYEHFCGDIAVVDLQLLIYRSKKCNKDHGEQTRLTN